ncbi:MAG: hypothetical protein JXR40_12220 [Pontiellaceae bacterium]|nr:hypothetical protein [Pontiellaceae bacterium]
MKIQAWSIAGVVVVLSGSTAFAQMPAGQGPGGAGQGRQGGARMIERFDTDGDGVLSDEERAAMEASRGTRRRGATTEAAATVQPGGPVAPAPEAGPDPKALMKEFDGNEDGVLNEAELTKLLASLKPPAVTPAPAAVRPGAGMQNREAMMEQYDANKDGQLDEEERAAMMEAMRGRMGEMGAPGAGMGAMGMGMGAPGAGAMPPEMMSQYDKDGDGQLSEEERTAMREAFRAGGMTRPAPAGAN